MLLNFWTLMGTQFIMCTMQARSFANHDSISDADKRWDEYSEDAHIPIGVWVYVWVCVYGLLAS
jgi:hypothetical protein